MKALILATLLASQAGDRPRLTPEGLDGFLKLVKPQASLGESEYMEKIRWVSTGREAKQRSVAENKPIFMLIAIGDPRARG